MKRKIFLGTGALILAAVGVFAGRATKKFTNLVTLYYKIGISGVCTNSNARLTAAGDFVTSTTAGTGAIIAQVSTAVSGTTTAFLYYTSSCGANEAVYFQP